MNTEKRIIRFYFYTNRKGSYQDADTCQHYYLSDFRRLENEGYTFIDATTGEIWTVSQLDELMYL